MIMHDNTQFPIIRDQELDKFFARRVEEMGFDELFKDLIGV